MENQTGMRRGAQQLGAYLNPASLLPKESYVINFIQLASNLLGVIYISPTWI